MRKILFRGKRISNGEWVEGGVMRAFHPNFDSTAQGFAMQEPNCYCICANYTDIFVEQNTIGQYTGLQDKNGKRIFEGDICRNTKTGEIVSVKWHGTMAGFVWNKRKENSHLSEFGELFRVYDKYEVIGNIHDNPELMDGGAENAAT